MRCKYCGQTLLRLAVMAIAEDSGCTVSPGSLYCYKSPDNEHDFSEPTATTSDDTAGDGGKAE